MNKKNLEESKMKRILMFRCFSMVLAFVLLIALLPMITPTTVMAAGDDAYTFGVNGTIDYDAAYDMLTQLNSLRVKVGVSALEMDSSLLNLATQRAAECGIYFSHTRPYGIDFFIETGYCENINAYTGSSDFSATESMEQFIDSPGHYANMISPQHNAVGIARFDQGNGSFYWVQIFDNGKITSPVSVSSQGRRQETKSVTALGSVLTLEIYPSVASIMVNEKKAFPLYNDENKGLIVPGVSATYGKGICQINPSYVDTSNSSIVTVDQTGSATGRSSGNATLKIGVGASLYKEVRVTVLADSGDENAATPVIDGPHDMAVEIGGTATLRVTATVSIGTLSYQWYCNTRLSTTGGTLINGATNAVYSAPTDKDGVIYYYCVVTNTDNRAIGNKTASKASRVAKVTVRDEDSPSQVVYKDRNGKEIPITFDHKLEWYLTNKTSSTYDPELAELAMALSASAYDESCIRESLKRQGFKISDIHTQHYRPEKLFDYSNVPCAIAKKKTASGDIVAVILKGTEPFNGQKPLADWINDTRVGFGDTHLRFEQGMTSVYSKLVELMKGISEQNVTYFITGHSKGAAIANLLAKELADSGTEQSRLFTYTFATPNVAVKTNLSQWNPDGKYDSIFNICNGKDAFPFLPRVLLYGLFRGHPNAQWGKYGQTRWFDSGHFSPISAHAKLTYLDWAQDRDYPNFHHNLDGTWSGFLITLFCPVDEKIVNSTGTVVARILDNQPQYLAEELDLILFTEDDSKYVLIHEGGHYSIRLNGTDDGTMDFSVHDIELASGTIGITKSFESVPLTDGKTMISDVGGSVKTSDVRLFETDTNGNTIDEVEGRIVMQLPFTDILLSDWYYETVVRVYQESLMVGTSETTFGPNGNVTIAQAITMAARAHAGGDDTFSNSGGAWPDIYVDYATINGIIKAGDFSNLNANATRAEMAYIFANVIPQDKQTTTSNITPPDARESDLYGKEIYLLYRTGVLMGNDSAGTFAPDANIIRAQAAAILLRIHLLLNS